MEFKRLRIEIKVGLDEESCSVWINCLDSVMIVAVET
jgi:hypothetical protein